VEGPCFVRIVGYWALLLLENATARAHYWVHVSESTKGKIRILIAHLPFSTKAPTGLQPFCCTVLSIQEEVDSKPKSFLHIRWTSALLLSCPQRELEEREYWKTQNKLLIGTIWGSYILWELTQAVIFVEEILWSFCFWQAGSHCVAQAGPLNSWFHAILPSQPPE
jgi:hypothetical protein